MINDQFSMAQFMTNIANVQWKIGGHWAALDYLEKSLVIFESYNCQREAAAVQMVVGRIYADPAYSGFDAEKAENHLLDAVARYEQLGARHHLYIALSHLAAFYKSQGRWEEYSVNIERYHELYVEVQNGEAKKQADRYGWEMTIAEMEKRKELEAIQIEAERRMMQQKMEMPQQMEMQTREVESTIRELASKNSFLHEIRLDVKRLTCHTRGEGLDILDAMSARLDRNIASLESNTDLEKQWSEVHAEFIELLHGRYPSLTTMELKISALLKMKLTSSNICSILFLSKRTVESHRLNIRKKMNLSKNDDLHVVLSML